MRGTVLVAGAELRAFGRGGGFESLRGWLEGVAFGELAVKVGCGVVAGYGASVIEVSGEYGDVLGYIGVLRYGVMGMLERIRDPSAEGVAPGCRDGVTLPFWVFGVSRTRRRNCELFMVLCQCFAK